MRLSGRVLWLTNDGASLRRQLRGADLDATASRAPELLFGVNTDLMISGAACTLGYTPEVLGPHFLEGLKGVVARDDVRTGGFSVLVAGDAYGSGSSREVAVTAHRGAGIELIVARSFQRIFQENLVYAGFPFSTDFGLLDRLRDGKVLDLDELTERLPPLFREIARAGGLLPFGTRWLAQTTETHPNPRDGAVSGQTCIEKLIDRHAVGLAARGDGSPPCAVRPGDQVLVRCGFRGLHEYTAGMVFDLYEREWGEAPLHDPSSVACFEDHFVLLSAPTVPRAIRDQRQGPARVLSAQMEAACSKHGLHLHGPGRALPAGVCHRVVLESYAWPGSVVILTDSHAPTAGVVNALAFGVGSTAMAFALRTGLVPVTVPKTVRVEVEGCADGIVSPKDLILHLIGDPYFRDEGWRASPTDTCVLEFAGRGLEQWTVDELSVLTNMTVEAGLMTGIVVPCAPVRAFLAARRPVENLEAMFVTPDPGAEYERIIRVKLEDVPLTVATPGDARNRARLDEHAGVPVHNVVIASCTGGSLADLRAAERILRRRMLAPGVRLTVTPSSAEVFHDAEREGILDGLRAAGALVTDPGCGACIGNGPGIPEDGETTLSTTNRNYDRRMGRPGPVYLASPVVAAASAVTGYLTDPRHLVRRAPSGGEAR